MHLETGHLHEAGAAICWRLLESRGRNLHLMPELTKKSSVLRKQNSTKCISRSNWLHWVICESGSIPPSKERDLWRATEMERFSEAERGSHKQKKGLFWVESPSFGEKRVLKGGFGGRRRRMWRIILLTLFFCQKITDWLHFWELKTFLRDRNCN